MKKLYGLMLIMLLSITALTACSSKDAGESASSDEAESEAQAEEPAEESAEMANPWTEADSDAAAAEGAGVGTFDFSEGMVLSLGEVEPIAYRYMEGIAEAEVPIAAVEMTIRKGLPSAAGATVVSVESSSCPDISGDYNEYKFTWTETIEDKEVYCFGNREGEATKSVWQAGDYCYSVTAYGGGGDTDYGLHPEDLAILVNGLK